MTAPAASHEFNLGDHVIVTDGTYAGYCGTLDMITPDFVIVILHANFAGLIVPPDYISHLDETEEDEDEEEEDTDDYEEREVVLELHDEKPGKRVIVLAGQFKGEAGRILGVNAHLTEKVGEEIVNVHMEGGGFLTAVAKRNVEASVYQGEAL